MGLDWSRRGVWRLESQVWVVTAKDIKTRLEKNKEMVNIL